MKKYVVKREFNRKNIVESFKLKKLLKFSKLIDFLPAINASSTEQLILKKWQDYFSEKGIPWATTTVDRKSFVLWKEDEVKEEKI